MTKISTNNILVSNVCFEFINGKPSHKLHFVYHDMVTMVTMHGHLWRGKESPTCSDEG